MPILNQARQDIIAMLKTAGFEAKAADIVFPPNPRLGDLSFPCFGLAKILKKSPGEAAANIYRQLAISGQAATQSGLSANSLIERAELAGPYINFFLNRKNFAVGFLKDVSKNKKFGLDDALKKERIMVEFVSPNNNKPLHLGHLRNAFLGESVARLLESQGIKVIRACLFNDRGLHIAKSMIAYQKWGSRATPAGMEIKGDKFVGDLYVKFEKQAKENPRLLEEAEQIVKLWEQGDKETVNLWKRLNTWALRGFTQTFKRLKIKFDISYFESKLWEKGKEFVIKGVTKKIFKKDKAGNIAADLSAFGLPPKVMLRADGTAIYATTDLYLGKEKFEKNKLTRAIWCVGSEQDLYFKQLFAIYQLFGFSWFERCLHLSYGLVFLPEGKMKSREGKVVEADDLMDELRDLVVEEIKARHKLSAAKLKKRAEIIAQAALRFYLLSVAPQTVVHFDPKSSIAFNGHTGPYLLYTYARIASILRKAAKVAGSRVAPAAVTWLRGAAKPYISDTEWNLIFKLAQFPEAVKGSALAYDPSYLAQYLYDLCKNFSDFYEKAPVLQAEKSLRQWRLVLLQSVRQVLSQGLKLLTIEPAREM